MNTAGTGGENPDALLAEAIVDDAVRRRRAENWSRRLAEGEASVIGTLAASVGAPVEVSVAGGLRITGTAVLVTRRTVVLEATSTVHWIRTDAIGAVAPASGRTAGEDASPSPAAEVELASLLADLVDDGRTIEVHLSSGAIWSGTVRAVGVALVLEDDGHRIVVDLDAVASVAVPR